jgi:beta-lysine N6-acetyltransferase
MGFDKTEKVENGSFIQHGKNNNRLYLIKISENVEDDFPGKLITMSKDKGYSKIFAKVPKRYEKSFLNFGYIREASIPKFYNGQEDGVFLAYYLSEEREKEEFFDEYEKNQTLAIEKKNSKIKPLDEKFKISKCTDLDAKEMSEVYKIVFPTYPFPIHDPEYIKDTMKTHIDYFCVKEKGEIISLSSSEMDKVSLNTEMTDFATLPKKLGNGFAVHLLKLMEEEAKRKDMKVSYTIARAKSPGMNITFSKMGYNFSGRLKNNTNISGSIESMNVWYKVL